MPSTQNKESDLVDDFNCITSMRRYLRSASIYPSDPFISDPRLKFNITYLGVQISVYEISSGYFSFRSDKFKFSLEVVRRRFINTISELITIVKCSVYLSKGTEGWSSGNIWYTSKMIPRIKSKNNHTHYQLLRDGNDTHLMILTNSDYQDCPLARVSVVYAIEYDHAIKHIKKIINHINKKDVKKPAQNFIY